MHSEFIVYACPMGMLAEQLELYFQTSLMICGENPAHRFMPHVSLTGFFQDQPETAALYAQTLSSAYEEHVDGKPTPALTINALRMNETFHGFDMESPWLHSVMKTFQQKAISDTRKGDIRLKARLHLSLAYEFPPEHHNDLKRIAEEAIDPSAEVEWELRLYERLPGNDWRCHWRESL